MSIKCSLLGHRFGETTVEREREEEGTEVVITITELETCTRCGETRVVSENKEVTTLETPTAGEPAPGAAGSSADAAAGSNGNAEVADDAGDAGTQTGAPAETAIPDAEAGTPGEADADDAVIIDGDDRGPGEWPDDEVDTADEDAAGTADDNATADGDAEREPGEWPEEPEGLDPAERAGETTEVEILGGDEGDKGAPEGEADAETRRGADADTASAVADDATDRTPDRGAVEARETGNADAASEPGTPGDAVDAASAAVGVDEDTAEWPEESGGVEETPGGMGDWPEETKRDEPAESGVKPTIGGEDGASITVPEGMFKCSECGYTTEVESSSLRAGDFCPKCNRGTLVQETDAAE